MSATRISLEVYRNPVIELGKPYTICDFLDQMLVLEVRSYLQRNTTDFASDSINWALSLNPEAKIVWEKSEGGEVAPIAWLSLNGKDGKDEVREEIQ